MITLPTPLLKQFAPLLDGLARVLLGLGLASMVFVMALTSAYGQATSPRTQNTQLIDRVLAIVNREVITASELARRERQFVAGLTQQGIAIPSRAILREQVLERMITDRAMLQLARETGIRIDEITLDRSIARIAEQNGVSVSGFRNQLESEGISFAAFREDVREEITLTRLREREVDNKLQITEAEVDTFLAAQGQSLQKTEEFRIAQILIRIPENPSPAVVAEAESRVKKAQEALRPPRSFASVVREFSDAQDREQGGSLGWRTRDRLPTLFLDAISGLKPGEISKPVRSPNGFHILQLEDQRSGLRTQEVSVHRARHILLRVDAQTSEEQARRRALELRRRIELGTEFGKVAQDHSQDLGSAPRGGELDWAYPGDTVPEFEQAMVALSPGQISDPVRSAFGIHLIQLLERKREPLTEQRLRTAARLALRDEKLAQAVADWAREVRANAYVEIKRDDR
ncbi:MAG: peptidylprolyl isomerase [Betaproteobacteria bacterium]|jgi:peptidyl-prolyl cis-trans isomerase SurA|nr:peptidylprolyl isomerase [Betaproteobacteria bacterium]